MAKELTAEARADIAEGQVATLEVALAASEARTAASAATVVALREEIKDLTTKFALVMEKLSQNSSNSHLPPSSDGPGATTRNQRRAAKKKPKRGPGGQPGHKGAYRELLPSESVDTVIDLFPEVCEGCGAQLRGTPDIDASRYQQLDIINYRPHLTEWRRHMVGCDRCSAQTRAEYDSSVIPALAFGPRVTSIVALFTGVYHLGRRKVQRIMHEVFGISVSLGAVSSMERRATQALEPAYREAEIEVEQGLVKHTDATSWLRAGKLKSLWVLATMSATIFSIFDDGRRDTILPFFGDQIGILVSDRASVFSFWEMSLRQICWAHLARKFKAFSERDGPAGTMGRELLDCTSILFEYWRGYKNGFLTRGEFQKFILPVRKQFEDTLERAKRANIRRVSGSCKDILAHREALWTFVTHEGVEPTNNHAERELRGFVLWRKRSFGCRSDRGERFAERLMTIAHTARKKGKSVLDFIAQSMTAQIEGTPPPRLVG